ncbi:hypothetical protein HanRHA438_Chr12g0561291 [Helianthus annuus]|nr:hypothetical protein HanHA89_Chr12g0476171 [Helianthus annuus]KAJ0867275.1 hypothetical protein HanRHA438_Chr12g0561291 [Helianthus annuus]
MSDLAWFGFGSTSQLLVWFISFGLSWICFGFHDSVGLESTQLRSGQTRLTRSTPESTRVNRRSTQSTTASEDPEYYRCTLANSRSRNNTSESH